MLRKPCNVIGKMQDNISFLFRYFFKIFFYYNFIQYTDLTKVLVTVIFEKINLKNNHPNTLGPNQAILPGGGGVSAVVN